MQALNIAGRVWAVVALHNICIYNNSVGITFDSAKDGANVVKHDVSLGLPEEFQWHTAVTWVDTRKDYHETPIACLGYVGLRLHAMVLVDRGDERLVIGLRKANRREVERYART